MLISSQSRSQLHKSEGLPKSEILRGHDVFQRIMKKPVVFSGKYLRAFADIGNNSQKDFSQSPLFTTKVKVGFVVAKKKVRKAVNRNRIKRLMREDYRRSASKRELAPMKVSLIFSLTDSGYRHFSNFPGTSSGIFADDLILISDKLKNSANRK